MTEDDIMRENFELARWIQERPVEHLPVLLELIVERCTREMICKSGGLEACVRRVEVRTKRSMDFDLFGVQPNGDDE